MGREGVGESDAAPPSPQPPQQQHQRPANAIFTPLAHPSTPPTHPTGSMVRGESFIQQQPNNGELLRMGTLSRLSQRVGDTSIYDTILDVVSAFSVFWFAVRSPPPSFPLLQVTS